LSTFFEKPLVFPENHLWRLIEPLPPEHLISSVNLRVEARGTEVEGTFRLLALRKLQDLPLP